MLSLEQLVAHHNLSDRMQNMSTRVVHAGDTRGLVYVWCALIGMTLLSVRDMLFITHEPLVTVLAVSVRLHMSIISRLH